MLFVPATPGSQLCKRVKDEIGNLRGPDGGLTKVVEAGGASILTGLARTDPFRVLKCPFVGEECWVKDGVDCWRTRVVYLVTCLLCGQGYRGTTGHSLHKRSHEHMKAVRNGYVTNAMGKHFNNKHLRVGRGDGFGLGTRRVLHT